MIVARIVALACCTALCAQQRQPLLGRVVDKDGAPVAAAKVTLVEDDADLAGIDPVDVVAVTTDDKGRFVAHALRGVRYTALAVGPEVDGKAMVARPVPDLACGRMAELQLLQPGERQRGTLPELDRWGGPAALCVRVRFEHCPGYAIEVPIAADASVELPPIAAVGTACLGPRTGGTIALLDPFAAPRFALRSATLRVQVVDDKGAPVAGARVAVQQKNTPSATEWARSPAVVTDREGRATLAFGASGDPFAAAPDGLVVVATKAGCAEAGSGWVCKVPFVDWSKVAEHADATVRLVLHEERPLHAVVSGAALAGRNVRVLALCNTAVNFGGFTASYYVPRSYDVAIAADGALEVPELPLSVRDVRLVLPPIDGRRVVLMPTHSWTLRPIALADCEPLSLQVLDAGRGPAAAAKVLLVPFACDGGDLEQAPPIVVDQAGRAEVLLQRGHWQVLAMVDDSWVWRELSEWSADAHLTLQLAPMPAMRVRVVDGRDQPVAGARFEPGAFWYDTAGGPGRNRLLAELGWNAFAFCVRRAETDARGEARIRALPWPEVHATVFACHGEKRRSADVPFAAGDEVRELKLTR